MKFLIFLTVVLLYVSVPTNQQYVTSCRDMGGIATFNPWPENALSAKNCTGTTKGLDGKTKKFPGTCTVGTVCQDENYGTSYVKSEPEGNCKEGNENGICCRISNTCMGKPALVEGGSQQSGYCLKGKFCPSGAAIPTNSCPMSGPSCCVAQTSKPQMCPKRYSAVEHRFRRVKYELDTNPVTDERLTNFLPYALRLFEEMRDEDPCPDTPTGNCKAATYLAFVYHMLQDFTNAPNDVIVQMKEALDDSVFNTLKPILQRHGGHITPEVFGDLMYELWTNKELNLQKYNSGNWADWVRLAYAVRGPNSGWDKEERYQPWFALTAALNCRPTRKTNLPDCDGGKGVCYINGQQRSAICEREELVEVDSRFSDCYNATTNVDILANKVPVACCRKPTRDETAISFDLNEYHNVRVAIDPRVPESESKTLIKNLQDAFTEASKKLYVATFNRAVFRSVRIILPDTWSAELANSQRLEEKLANAEFIIKKDLTVEDEGSNSYRITMNTVQVGKCGVRGFGTTMTPKDVAAKLAPMQIVKHFSMGRYGIFSEFPRFERDMDPFKAMADPPERCSKDNATRSYYCDGEFEIKIKQDQVPTATASINWIPDYRKDVQGVDNIIHFCDDCVKEREHNKELGNAQNHICNKRGTYNIMLENEDFYGEGNPARLGVDTTPTFTIVHRNYKKTTRDDDYDEDEEVDIREASTPKTPIVLVLDESADMTDKLGVLKAAVGQMIDVADAKVEFAVVSLSEKVVNVRSQFESTASTDGKKKLKDAVFSMAASGKLCLKDGLNKAFELLEQRAGGQIIVFAKGVDECGGDYVKTLGDKIRQSGVTIHTCAFSETADRGLTELAAMTNGKAILIPRNGDITHFLVGLQSLFIEATQDDASTERTIVRNKQIYNINANTEQLIDSFILDNEKSYISVLYDKNDVAEMSGYLKVPDGTIGTTTQYNCEDDHDHGKLICNLKVKPLYGKWTLHVRAKTADTSIFSTSVTVSISSAVDVVNDDDSFAVTGFVVKPKIIANPLEIQPWERSKLFDISQAYVAQVSYGGRFAVLNADVTAVITSEDGTVTWRETLSDKGEAYKEEPGADLYENDGVYSSVSTRNFSLSKPGRYSVQLEVVAHPDKAFHTKDVLLGIPKSATYLADTKGSQVKANFRRSLSIGMFEIVRIVDESRSSGAGTPRPGRVESLKLIDRVVKGNEAHFTFTFMTAGRDGMGEGQPDNYMLNASTNILNVQGRGEEIELTRNTEPNLLLQTFTHLPNENDAAGDAVMIKVALPLNDANPWHRVDAIYFSVSALNKDEIGRPVFGLHSNIIISSIDELMDSYSDLYTNKRCESCDRSSSSPVKRSHKQKHHHRHHSF